MTDIPDGMIELSDQPSSQNSTDDSIIFVEDTENIANEALEYTVVDIEACQNMYHGNKQINKIIQICMKLEHSKGMARVINKCMLTFYDEADKEYKDSEHFKKVLKRTISRLQTDPQHKFSHIKNLCETLKLHKLKKRVNLVTLTTSLGSTDGELRANRSTDAHIERPLSCVEKTKKRQKIDVIDLDDDQEAVIVLDSDNEISLTQQNCRSNKENNSHVNEYKKYIRMATDNFSTEELNNNVNSLQNELSDLIHRSDINVNEIQQSLLVPIEARNTEAPVIDKTKELKEIEEEIAQLKHNISLLDIEEVCQDSTSSPYIKSEKYKARIVQLYKQLCDITGDEPIKRREVRLRVLPGRSPWPVKYLEEFLNNKIGDNGEPPFPDYHDVALCVAAANQTENLGWNTIQIMNEANALFTQCGRALQRNRQKREWRDMLGLVNVKEIRDPADEDPELMKRLEENKRLAQKKEEDWLTKFSSMEYEVNSEQQSRLIVANEEYSSDESKDDGISCADLDHSNVNIKSANDSAEKNKNIKENSTTAVKVEPQDVSSLFQELGNSFSTTIIEVIDPFLVIEISSDSEDDDEVK